MVTNNQYWKQIYENLTNQTVTGNHPDNYYMRLIAIELGNSYNTTNCNNRYAKDMAHQITGETYDKSHYTHYYIKEMAEGLTGETYKGEFDNYLLSIIAENIGNKSEATLTWQVPPSDMEYGDFNATGLLTGENNTPITDATVYLVVGSTKVDNAKTKSNGVVTFTGSPVHTGTHSFKLVFEGNINYTSSESSTVTITVSKETTYLNFTEYPTIGYTDGNIRFAGQLLDNDSPRHFVANKFIKLMNVYTQEVYDTVETDSSGRFVSEFNISTPGTYAILVLFEGNNDYNDSEQSFENIVINDPSLDLVANPSILSYANGDEAVLTATLYSSDKVGKAVSFDIVDGQGTILSHIGDSVTGSDGKARFTYESQGVGDIIVQASATVKGMFVSKTYSIKDTLKYISDTLTSTQTLNIPNIPQNFKATFKVKCDNITASPTNNAWLEIGSDDNNLILFGNTGSRGHIGIFVKVGGRYVANQDKSSLSAQTWTELTYTYEDGVQTISDGTETVTVNNSQITGRNYVYFRNASSNRNPIKELMILPL